ncbi:major facilitator superfamily domain-containing protein [Coniochaeta sp. 2T2.1]|nr:major facilitator superfamily domain-containing protein [Coniochaeta sp. 2T2.1]
MHEQQLHRARIVSSVAATLISLACGTNYVYSAWAPQYQDRLQLSATESNIIGLAGNLGMYSLGVPVGLFVDHKGPRPAVLAGSILLGLGYFPFRASYVNASGSVPLMCFFAFLTGFGSCMAFAAAVKTSALNWPHHRGTATAFPLAAFGLSAFFFSMLGSVFFNGNTSDFLMLLAAGTFGIIFIGFFFLRVLPPTSYHVVSGREGSMTDSQRLRRTSSDETKARAGRVGVFAAEAEPGTLSPTTTSINNYNTGSGGGGGGHDTAAAGLAAAEAEAVSQQQRRTNDVEAEAALTTLSDGDDGDRESDETSSLMSKKSSLSGDVFVQSSVDLDRSHRVDIRGWRLLSSLDFWQLFSILGILAGIGLMTINNIGHNAHALWKHYDDSVDEKFLTNRQQMHVSILSVGSFVGRLLSGIGSDFLVKVLKASRVWCLVLASFIFCIAQILALRIENPYNLWSVSSLSGLGYGFLFGVFPSIVAETFGIHGLSQNWGFMTLSPAVSGNVFNIFYGLVFDRHSHVGPDGERTCFDGVECYRAAYFVTLCACGLGLVTTLAVIRHQYLVRLRELGKTVATD